MPMAFPVTCAFCQAFRKATIKQRRSRPFTSEFGSRTPRLFMSRTKEMAIMVEPIFTPTPPLKPLPGQKWVFSSTTNTWNLVYTLQTGLGLGVHYTVQYYPTGNNVATGLPWAPAADGLRNITGLSLGGYAAISGITSTISGNGDQGADPNQLVLVFDSLPNTDPPVAATETLFTLPPTRFTNLLRRLPFT